MKIKTITCHDVYNLGASLQAYALMEYLQSLGHNVEIIDYKPDYLNNHYSLSLVSNPKFDVPLVRQLYLLAKLPERIIALKSQRKKNFDDFRNRYLLLTQRYESYSELEKRPPIADIYFAGSDQIWNTLFQNGKDPAFYLKFTPSSSIRASYAASFATDEILEDWKPKIKEWLSELDYISVRESSGAKIVRQLGLNAVQVLDPVFLLDAKEWELLCQPMDQKYIFIYDFDANPEIRKMAEALSLNTGLPIYTLQNLGYGVKAFPDTGPLEFLSLVHGAEYVLSNSFHATAFSIIFEKEFWVTSRKEKINTRMRDLAISLDVSERFINKVEDMNLSRIDYDKVQYRMKRQIQDSKRYIDLVISGGKSYD